MNKYELRCFDCSDTSAVFCSAINLQRIFVLFFVCVTSGNEIKIAEAVMLCKKYISQVPVPRSQFSPSVVNPLHGDQISRFIFMNEIAKKNSAFSCWTSFDIHVQFYSIKFGWKWKHGRPIGLCSMYYIIIVPTSIGNGRGLSRFVSLVI